MFVQPHTQRRLTIYQLETVPILILDENQQAQSYAELQIDRSYIALTDDTYIMLCMQELNTCKKIGYEYYCEELFVVKSKNGYSCASAIFFNLSSEIIKQNFEFR